MTIRREIKTSVSFMMSGIAPENTEGRPKGEFVGGCSRQVRITGGARNAEVIVGGHSAKEGEVWGGRTQRFDRQDVNKIFCCLHSLDTEGRWEGSLE